MKIHALRESPEAGSDLAKALERFERSFRYPLGATGHFQVRHGRDYLRFFAAMGDPLVLVAERRGEVLGTLAGIPRTLRLPAGAPCQAVYLCDCKVAPHAGRTLLALAKTMEEIFSAQVAGRAYGVVMDGTPRLPAHYTGRCGILAFEPLSGIRLFHFSTAGWSSSQVREIEIEALRRQQDHWTRGSVLPQGGLPELRSQIRPRPLNHPAGTAIGILEDTRRGKRLIDGAGREMLNAHFSAFSFENPAAGADLIRRVLPLAAEAGFSGLFTAVPESQAAALREALSRLHDLHWSEAPATVFGHGLSADLPWEISTSEI